MEKKIIGNEIKKDTPLIKIIEVKNPLEKKVEPKKESINIKKRKEEITNFKLVTRKKDLYTTPGKKLPLKNELIAEYTALCKKKGITPAYKEHQFGKVTKRQIADLIEDVNEGTVTVEQKPELTSKVRKKAAKFFFKLEHLAAMFLEGALEKYPKYNINGYSDDMRCKKKYLIEEIDDILETHPEYQIWVDPLLIHGLTHGHGLNSALNTNRKKIGKKPPNDLYTTTKTTDNNKSVISKHTNMPLRKKTKKRTKKFSTDVGLKTTTGVRNTNVPGYKL